MTGFIRGLFGGKKNNGEQAPKPSRAPNPPKDNGTFYLSNDDAKSYGDIDYMRSAKTVKRTFARKKGVAKTLESVKQVSAMDSMRMRENGVPEPKSTDQSQVVQNGSVEAAPKFDRRKADSSLDMFRTMAKDMKK